MKNPSKFKIAMAWIGGVAAFFLVLLLLIFAFGGLKWITASFRGEVDARERTEASGAFRLATYEEFFNLCADVQTKEASISNLKEELETSEDAQRQQVINTSVTALRNSRAESINKYNSLAAQEHRQAFRDNDLPARLNINEEITECAF
jgi:Na+-transporting methylmalonyl-CoA/oxaloacetate decarboxylase gamma subunit